MYSKALSANSEAPFANWLTLKTGQIATVRPKAALQHQGATLRKQALIATIDFYEQSILPDARENLRLSQQALDQGQLDLLRFLQAQRSLFEANLDYISAELEEVTSAAEIAGLLQEERFP